MRVIDVRTEQDFSDSAAADLISPLEKRNFALSDNTQSAAPEFDHYAEVADEADLIDEFTLPTGSFIFVANIKTFAQGSVAHPPPYNYSDVADGAKLTQYRHYLATAYEGSEDGQESVSPPPLEEGVLLLDEPWLTQ
jgi:hypothetical protein